MRRGHEGGLGVQRGGPGLVGDVRCTARSWRGSSSWAAAAVLGRASGGVLRAPRVVADPVREERGPGEDGRGGGGSWPRVL